MWNVRSIMKFLSAFAIAGCITTLSVWAQQAPSPGGVVDRTIAAINYRYRGGDTRIDFVGTRLLPAATGQARVEVRQGYLEIKADFRGIRPAREFGREYLAYVLWAITPEGRAENLGEVIPDDKGRGELNVTTQLQALGLIVTAEPYFSIVEPSSLVVLENTIRPDTRGAVDQVQAQYELLNRGSYVADGDTDPLAALLLVVDPKVPIHLYQARNAVRIARAAGAEQYAPDAFQKAMDQLLDAEAFQAYRNPDARTVTTAARRAVQTAEDARLLTISRIEDERLSNERQAAAEREADARREAEEQTALRARAEQALEEAERLRTEAEGLRIEAETQRAEAEAQKREAETQRQLAEQAAAAAAAAEQDALYQKSLADQEATRAKREAREADLLRARAENDRAEMRARLETQLNRVLETTNTARGLIVNMSDVLFDTGQYTVKQPTREALARISGILSMQPDLTIAVEGHTDDVGPDDYNQTLSEKRANAVRDYLIQQGIDAAAITATGFGEQRPRADNASPDGRRQNRRVELVVSGTLFDNREAASLQ